MGIVERLTGPFRRKRKPLEIPPIITVGTALPEVEVEVVVDGCVADEQAGGEGCATMPLREALGEGQTVLVGMPGAFTPTCTMEHLPGLLNLEDKLKLAGVSRVAVITTNDRFVNAAWAEQVKACQEGEKEIVIISDADGDAVKALGLVEDMGYGFNVRSKRFAIIAEDGVVSNVAVDEGMEVMKASSAEAILAKVEPEKAASGALDNLTEEQQKAGLALGAALLLGFFLTSGGNDGGASTDAAVTAASAVAASKGAATVATNKAVVAKAAASKAAASKAAAGVPAKNTIGATVSSARTASGYQMLK